MKGRILHSNLHFNKAERHRFLAEDALLIICSDCISAQCISGCFLKRRHFLSIFGHHFENVTCYNPPLGMLWRTSVWRYEGTAISRRSALISCPGYATNCFICKLSFLYEGPLGPGRGHWVQVQLPGLCVQQTRAVSCIGSAAHFCPHAWLISCNQGGCEFSKLPPTVTHIRTAINWVSMFFFSVLKGVNSAFGV